MRLKLRTIVQHARVARALIADERGVTSLEYGLIAAVMVIAIASTIRGVAAPITAAFQRVYDSFF
jgi:Flp pilus assembly pilin Flp